MLGFFGFEMQSDGSWKVSPARLMSRITYAGVGFGVTVALNAKGILPTWPKSK